MSRCAAPDSMTQTRKQPVPVRDMAVQTLAKGGKGAAPSPQTASQPLGTLEPVRDKGLSVISQPLGQTGASGWKRPKAPTAIRLLAF